MLSSLMLRSSCSVISALGSLTQELPLQMSRHCQVRQERLSWIGVRHVAVEAAHLVQSRWCFYDLQADKKISA